MRPLFLLLPLMFGCGQQVEGIDDYDGGDPEVHDRDIVLGGMVDLDRADPMPVTLEVGQWIGDAEEIVIDEYGATWDGYFEVVWPEELDQQPVVRIRAPNNDLDGPAGHRELKICTDDSVGPTDLVHTTEAVPFGICNADLWTVDFRIDARARTVREQLRLDGQKKAFILAELEPRKTFMVGAHEVSAYQANSMVGDNVAGISAFRRCVLYKPNFGGW